MPIDVNRFGFLISEFRYNSAIDATIAARYQKARRMDLDTNLDDGAAAQTLCNDMYAVVGAPRRRFQVSSAGTTGATINDFAGAVKGATLISPEFNVTNLPVIVTRIVIDEDEDQVISEVWG